MIFKQGNLFDTDAPAIGHGVNCRGVMGAGIAVQFRDRHPDMYANYRALCENGTLVPGTNFLFDVPVGPTVINMATQRDPGPNARLEWVRSCAEHAVQAGLERGWDRIAVPQIGCGIGGLKLADVIKHLEQAELLVGRWTVQFEMWEYKP